MAGVYVIDQDGNSTIMDRVKCTNEDRELQTILEKNPDLLPGDQIDPDNPRRWLLVKREMPVPGPDSGSDRWSIDFLFADQDAIPTFVECKRYADTRSRREVIGQMLEYAANGHHYWEKDELRNFAQAAADKGGKSLEDAVRIVNPDSAVEEFFERMQENLRQGQVRIVFFMEQSPMELRSVVDFLNKQMERSEVLLVEARQYCSGGLRVVAPALFGYTEAARQVKRTVTVAKAARSLAWNEQSFLSDTRSRISPAEADTIEKLLKETAAAGFEVSWGTGKKTPSFNLKAQTICPRAIVQVNSNGWITFNFTWLNGSDAADRARHSLFLIASNELKLKVADEKGFLAYPIGSWGQQVDVLIEGLKRLLKESYEASVEASA